MMRIKIGGEIYTVASVFNGGYLPLISVEGSRMEFYLARDSEHAGEKAREYWEDMARDSEHAGEKAREYWEDMAHDDPREFTCLIGEKRLVQWALEQSDSYGFSSLNDFLDAVERVPEEEWGDYDGTELEVEHVGRLVDELGFTPTVAYRHN